jgi:hypothetical protein
MRGHIATGRELKQCEANATIRIQDLSDRVRVLEGALQTWQNIALAQTDLAGEMTRLLPPAQPAQGTR